MRAYCKECRRYRHCLERTRDLPCTSYGKRRRRNGRHKRTDSYRTGCALEKAHGAATEAEEKGSPAAAGTSHEPDHAVDHLHHGSGDLGTAGGADLKGGENDDGSGV